MLKKKIKRLYITCLFLLLGFLPISNSHEAVVLDIRLLPRNVRISPNGTRAAVSTPTDVYISIYDADTGKKRSQFTEPHLGEEVPPAVLTFSPDGSSIASAYRDFIYVWDTTTTQVLATLDEQPGPISALAFSPDATRLAVAGADWTVRLWEVRTGTFLRSFSGHPSAVNAIAFSPDGNILASAGSTLRLWDTDTGELRNAPDKDLGSINLLVFSPDGKILATGGGWDFTVHLWDVKTTNLLKSLKIHTGEIRDIAFSSDGHTLVTASKDKTITLWDVNTGRQQRRFPAYQDKEGMLRTKKIRKTYDVAAVQFSPDGKYLRIASRAGTLHFYEIETGRYRGNYFDLISGDP